MYRRVPRSGAVRSGPAARTEGTRRRLALGIAMTALLACGAADAQPGESMNAAPGTAPGTPPAPTPALTYADLADLAAGTPTVVRAKVRSTAPVEAARAPGLRPGVKHTPGRPRKGRKMSEKTPKLPKKGSLDYQSPGLGFPKPVPKKKGGTRKKPKTPS